MTQRAPDRERRAHNVVAHGELALERVEHRRCAAKVVALALEVDATRTNGFQRAPLSWVGTSMLGLMLGKGEGRGFEARLTHHTIGSSRSAASHTRTSTPGLRSTLALCRSTTPCASRSSSTCTSRESQLCESVATS